jgi:hypothetical protein
MYAIRWNDGRDNMLVGEYVSVKSMAHILESKTIKFTVTLIGCLPMSKPNMGWKYWVTELF